MSDIDSDFIAEYYSKMTKDEFERIVLKDAHGLRPEVFGIIEQEIIKRGLNQDLLNAVIAQNKEYSLDEIENYSNFLRVLPCPICDSTLSKLNGTISYTVKSFVIISSYKKVPLIACPNCLDKSNNKAILVSALLGWWGIPWGILKTPLFIYKNIKAKNENKLDHSNSTLLSFTLGHIGEIETYKNNTEMLKSVIKFF